MKGSLFQAELGAHNANQVAGMLAVQSRHNTTKSRKSLQTGGVMYVKDAVRKIEAKKIIKDEAARKKAERMFKAAERAALKEARESQPKQPRRTKKIIRQKAADNEEISSGLIDIARGLVE